MLLATLVSVFGLITSQTPQRPYPVPDRRGSVMLMPGMPTEQQRGAVSMGIPAAGWASGEADPRGDYVVSNVKPGKYVLIFTNINPTARDERELAKCRQMTGIDMRVGAHCELLEVAPGDDLKRDWNFQLTF